MLINVFRLVLLTGTSVANGYKDKDIFKVS